MMKNLVFLYIDENSAHAFEKVFSEKSCFEKCLEWAADVSSLCGIVVACFEENKNTVEQALKWASESSGILTFTFHWFSPLGGKGKSFYSKNFII